MDFKTKVAEWQKVCPSGGTEKTAGLLDWLGLGDLGVHGATAADSGGRGGPFSGSSYMAKLIGADTVGGAVNSLIGAPLSTYSYRANKSLNDGFGGLLDRVKADEAFASSLVGSAAKTTADVATAAVGDAIGALKKQFVDTPKRQEILAHLRKTDDIIGNADMNSVLEAYSSMTKFAPKLSTNLSAAKSFLREAVQHDGGIDFMTVKGLAQAERAITGQPIGGN